MAIIPYVRRLARLWDWRFALLTGVLALLSMWHVLVQPGWPENHEGMSFFYRMQVWVEHLRDGDVLPVWSATDGFGYGTPMPLYYQKLFYIPAALLFMVLGDPKAAVVITILMFMLLGAYGLRAALRQITDNKWLYTLVPPALFFTTYTYTDWLIRGAMAEFSAMMLVPWLLWWSMVLIRTGHFLWWIIIIFAALFHAHNALALLALPIPALAFVIHCVQRWKDVPYRRAMWLRPLVAGMALAMLVGMPLVVQSMMSRDFDPAGKINQGYELQAAFQQPIDYLEDRDYDWLNDWQGYTVEVNWLLWVPIGMVSAWLGWRTWREKKKLFTALPQRWIGIWSGILGSFYIFMQLPVSLIVYENVPLIRYIQFPWRLLAIMVPLALVVLVWLVVRVRLPARWLPVAAVMWLAAFALTSPLTAHNRIAFKPDIATTGTGFYEGGEYTPITEDGRGGELSGWQLIDQYRELYADNQPVAHNGCRITGREPYPTEDLWRRFTIDCQSAARFALPLTYSRFTIVSDETGKRLTTERVKTDPRLHVRLAAGENNIIIQEPALPVMLRYAWDELGN